MSTTERDYVLGTNDHEISRLGVQHQVWRTHDTAGWRRAGFTRGQTLLDVGCGPGWATIDLAELAGPQGRVIGIDRSRRFLDAGAARAQALGLTNIEWLEQDLEDTPLPALHADGAWSRWVYAFMKDPRALLRRVAAALRPGGTLVMHEYCDYRAFRLAPRSEVFEGFVREVMASWRETGGEPDIGLRLPGWLEEAGLELSHLSVVSEAARPCDHVWAWPQTFLASGVARLVELGRIDAEEAARIHAAFEDASQYPGGFLITPTVLEVVAKRR